MSHDVFISHSQHDSAMASEICKVLEEAGIRCWIAHRDIVAGRNWGASIVQAIGASRLLVLVFSAQSNTSQQVLREVERAVSRNVTVLPYRIAPVEPSPELEYYLSVTHWLNAFDSDHAKSLADLARTARDILATNDARRPKVESAQQPEKDHAELYRSCPYCAERIRVDAKICRFCNRDLTPRASALAEAAIRPVVSVPSLSSPEVTGAGARQKSPIMGDSLTPQQVAALAPERIAAPRWDKPEVRARDNVRPVGADVEGPPSPGMPDQLWQWIDRLLPAGTLVVAFLVTMMLATGASAGTSEISLVETWLQLSSLVRVTGVLCPILAVSLCAIGSNWSKSRSLVVMLAAASFAAPFMGMWNIRQGIVRDGSASLGAVAGGLLDTLFTVPFVCAAGLALAISIMPRHPQRRYQSTIIGLSVLAMICVLTNAIALRDVVGAAAGANSLGIAGWLVQLVSP